MMFLEEVLGNLVEKADVMVMLSSNTVYGIGETDTPLVMQDGCGNHHTRNWLEAIECNGLKKMFIVKEVTVSYESYMDKPQWKIVLENGKDEYTNKLGVESNRAACARVFE